MCFLCSIINTFLSTLSLRRATVWLQLFLYYQEFLSTLSLRRATNSGPYHIERNKNFYPRSPCGERLYGFCEGVFLLKNFYPRSPCGERPHPIGIPVRVVKISIHALLAESDIFAVQLGCRSFLFLSTLSLRRATKVSRFRQHKVVFLSTLSLRRATSNSGMSSSVTRYFYPRSPCGERLPLLCSTLCCGSISIHALLAESDDNFNFLVISVAIFLSTLSLRRATTRKSMTGQTLIFLSTLSLRRATK